MTREPAHHHLEASIRTVPGRPPSCFLCVFVFCLAYSKLRFQSAVEGSGKWRFFLKKAFRMSRVVSPEETQDSTFSFYMYIYISF